MLPYIYQERMLPVSAECTSERRTQWRFLVLNNIKTQETVEQLAVSSERTLPANPFPRKYFHSVIDDLQDAVQAVFALRADGYQVRDIHVMSCWDYAEAVERKYRQQSRISKMLSRLISSFDEGFGDVYLHEARRGHHILAVRLSRSEEMEQVRDLLAPCHARLMKYVDTWTVIDLPSSRGDNTSLYARLL